MITFVPRFVKLAGDNDSAAAPLSEVTPEQWAFLDLAKKMVGPNQLPMSRDWEKRYPERAAIRQKMLRDTFAGSHYSVRSKPVVTEGDTLTRSVVTMAGPGKKLMRLTTYRPRTVSPEDLIGE